jgi:lipid-binding SYLF domain-containing protein
MKKLPFATSLKAATAIALLSLPVVSANASESTPASEPANSSMSASEVAKKRQEILAMRDATLKRLYKVKPSVRNEIAKADGYAVFDANQTNIVLLVAGAGNGVLIDNASGQPTFMKMRRLGTGPGLGFKKYKQVLVFKSRKLVDTFKTVGADVTASGDATFKLSEHQDGKGVDHAVSLDPMISVYQLTDRGVLLQANWGGMAYLPDSSLNTPASSTK